MERKPITPQQKLVNQFYSPLMPDIDLIKRQSEAFINDELTLSSPSLTLALSTSFWSAFLDYHSYL